MVEVSAMRQGPLDFLASAARACTAVELSVAPPCAKFSVRGRAEVFADAGNILGVALPAACRATASKDRAALWLGPDEWLLLAAEADADTIADQLSAALAGTHHALADVSYRSVGILLKGPQAAALVNHGCPLDLSHASFPVGMCTRTLFEKAEIILWRTEEHTYHVEIERSFAAYVWTMLIEVRREFA